MDRPSQKSKAYLADNLYHHYLFERIFKVNLFNCLLQNIERVNAKLGYTVDGGETLRTLCKCLNLPNTFSRTYMLQYAFDQFFIAPDSSTDFWSLLKDMHPVSEIKGQIKGFQYPMWVTQYGYFCDYLSKYIIPVYEWCFTNLVMDYISLKFPVSTSCSHTKQLYEAMLFLAEYMGSHYQSFITPLGKTKAPKTINKKVLPLILPNNMYYPHLLPDTIKKIQHFFWQSDLSFRNASGKYLLDSPFLTPDFFLKKQSGAYSSLHNITTFYSNLVRDLYFD